MQKVLRINPVVRAVGVIAAVAVLVTGVTFAALDSSSASLTGNTVSSATADLTVSTNGSTFDSTKPGFDFEDVVPGGDPVPETGHAFWLQNEGAADLDLTATLPGTITTDPALLDLTKVHLIITDPGADEALGGGDDTEVLNATFADLNAGEESIDGQLGSNDIKKFVVQVSMDANAFDGSSGSISAFDIEFNGTNSAESEL